MSTATTTKTAIPGGLDGRALSRVFEEGYGPGAWHGPDLKAALFDVAPALAFWRPGQDRHNIAEIALHHAWCTRSARGQLSGQAPEAFVMEGEDWFELGGRKGLGWPEVKEALEAEESRLSELLKEIAAGRMTSPLPESERFDLVLGVTCHAVYHAGQVQLIKALRG